MRDKFNILSQVEIEKKIIKNLKDKVNRKKEYRALQYALNLKFPRGI